MNLREQFEKLHPVPEGAGFSMLLNQYCALPSKVDRFGEIGLACEAFNLIWQGFQSGHAAQAKRIAELEKDRAEVTALWRSLESKAVGWRNKIAELGSRLEIGTGPYDGIAARDETIRLLEAQLQSHSANTVGGPTPVEQLLADYRNGIPIEVSPETRALAEKVVASKSVLKMSEQELRDWAHRMTNRSNADTRTAGESDS